MIEDFRQFLKIYRMYKKGKSEMEKAKNWVMEHKKELAVTAGLIFAYHLGFKNGCQTTDKAVSNLFKEAAKAMEVTRF